MPPAVNCGARLSNLREFLADLLLSSRHFD
jgi:hypothetical protein